MEADDRPLTIAQTLAMLADTPVRIADISKDLSPAWFVTPPDTGEWSARDVLAHLRACADVWGKYIVEILSKDQPTIRVVSPRTWIKQTDYPEQEFFPSLQAFTAQRAGLLAVLKPLGSSAWSRTATITGAGKPREQTVLTFAQRLADHERLHLRQIAGIAKEKTP